MTDPAIANLVFTLVAGVGIAVVAVLLLLGVLRLVRGPARPAAAPVVEAQPDVAAEPVDVTPVELALAEVGPVEVEMPTPRAPAAEEHVADEHDEREPVEATSRSGADA